MSNYSKNLQGENSKLFVSPQVEYTTDASIRLFMANAASGEIGVYLEDGTLQTGALTAGDVFKVVQMRDGYVNATPLVKFSEIVRSIYIDYVAPVRQISYIGYANTGSDDLSFDFTGASVTNALTAGISVRDTSPGNMPFPVQEGYATITSATQDEYTTLASIVSDLNGDYDYERTQPDRFVKAEITSNGSPTYLSSTIDPTLVNGSTVVTYSGNVTVAAGAFLTIRGAIYKVATGVTSGTSLIIDRPYQGASETIDVSAETTVFGNAVAYTSGTTKLGVRLTSLFDESHFKVVGVDNLYLSPVTYSTAWKLGTGSYDKISEWENRQAAIWDGVGSTVNAAFASDYGQPTKFAGSTLLYDLLLLEIAPSIQPSAVPTQGRQVQFEKIAIAIPNTGTTPEAELKTVFGL